ncbi:MAG: hypothetical protein HFACDABA_02056 [Anaerolineales bacterium]|nr:hypothetical protein [Anaerolineales bacterium]
MSRRVWLFGALRIEQNERSVSLGGKLASLFAYLVLHPHPHPRERLADLLLPDAPADRAARNLSNLLYRLRQTLGPDWLDADEAHVALRLLPDLWVEAQEFRRLAASGDPDAQHASLSLYRDDLLPELYEDWLLPLRVDLREIFLQTLERLSERAEQAQDYARAFEYFHRFAFADPLNEGAQRGLMRVYARTGRHAAALHQYNQLVKTLTDELGIEPVHETRALAESIRLERGTQAAAPKPFVGRRQERARLLELVERAQEGRGGFILLEGEAGIGKTRLLEMAEEAAAWRGMTVTWGRARELTGITPYSPLDQVLRAACAGPRIEQLRARLAPPFAEALAGLEPRLRARRLAVKPAEVPPLAEALTEGLCALVEIAPRLIILDDAQWADDSIWDALWKLAPRLETRRILVVLAYRADEVRVRARAWNFLRDLDREFAPPRIALGGLSAAECEELARSLGQPLDKSAAQDLQQRANGNPLLAQAVLQTGQDAPSSYAGLFALRLSRLSGETRAALEAGAVLGREFTHGAWQSLAGQSVLAALPTISEEGFIYETENGYLFEHDLAREAVYNAIENERLRDLHRRAGEALEREYAEPSALAWHFEQAEDWQMAVRYYREAGDRAVSAYAYDTALQYYERAGCWLDRLEEPRAESLALLLRRQEIYRVKVQEREWRATVEQLEHAALEMNDRAALLEALRARVSLHLLDSKWTEMQDAAERAIALAQEVGDPAAEAHVRAEIGWHLADMLGRPGDALPHLVRAAELAERLNDIPLWLEALGQIAFTQRILGRTFEARSAAERALAIAGTREDLRRGRAGALEILGQIELDLAHWQAARAIMHEFTTLADELHEHWLSGQGFFNQSLVAARSGRYQDAQDILGSLKSLLTAAGLGAPADHWMWSEALNAEALVLAGNLEQAEIVLDGMRAWMESKTGGRPLLLALTALGRLRLAQNRPGEAGALLARAVRLWKQAGGTIEIAPLLLHALAAHRTGNADTARASLRDAENILLNTPVATHAVLLRFVRYEVTGNPESLRAAREEIQRQAALFTDENLRADFLNNVALHHTIEEEWQRLYPAPAQMTIHLARADAPLGRALNESDFVAIQWTVDAGEDDAAILQRAGKAALRRHRLARLIREAREQNASPTDADLARALGVNTRTIERDIATLRGMGQKAMTRKRKS